MAKIADHKATPYIIMDFETAGKEPAKNAMTEFAAIAITGDTLEEIGRYESLIKPYEGFEYDEGALHITGITKNLLEREGKTIQIVGDEMIKFFEQSNVHNSKTGHKPIYVAHNGGFELQCLQHVFKVIKKPDMLSKLFQGQHDFYGNFIPYSLDTMLLAKLFLAHNQRQKGYTLEAVCAAFNIELNDGHRAMNDVIPSKELLIHLIKLMRAQSSGKSDGDGSVAYRDTHFFQL